MPKPFMPNYDERLRPVERDNKAWRELEFLLTKAARERYEQQLIPLRIRQLTELGYDEREARILEASERERMELESRRFLDALITRPQDRQLLGLDQDLHADEQGDLYRDSGILLGGTTDIPVDPSRRVMDRVVQWWRRFTWRGRR
jgi:hypothetical protein